VRNSTGTEELPPLEAEAGVNVRNSTGTEELPALEVEACLTTLGLGSGVNMRNCTGTEELPPLEAEDCLTTLLGLGTGVKERYSGESITCVALLGLCTGENVRKSAVAGELPALEIEACLTTLGLGTGFNVRETYTKCFCTSVDTVTVSAF
jgi:hypothetical protein